MSKISDNYVRPEFGPDSETYQIHYDTDSTWKVSTTLILAVSSLTGDDPVQMLPLNRAVDPDALGYHVRDQTRNANLSFDFHGHHVTVHDDGRIEISSLDG